jgi:redox-sensitive bicupin YhaK (pirin superfamily)
VTFLWEGTITHRDTLGSVQDIQPGDVNWMTAGRGIAHSERTPLDLRGAPHPAHGMQTWVALPKSHEEVAPAFFHHDASSLPRIELPGVVLRVIAGRAFGEESPVGVFADTFNVAVDMEADAEFAVDARAQERALYVLRGRCAGGWRRHSGAASVGARSGRAAQGACAVAGEGDVAGRRAVGCASPHVVELRVVVEGPDRAGEGGLARGRFGVIAGETEFIPLPD